MSCARNGLSLVLDGEPSLCRLPFRSNCEDTRRRSFHDLKSLRAMPVLTAERMKIDVEIAGQVLIMARREQHLRNVVACLEVNISLSTQFRPFTNIFV